MASSLSPLEKDLSCPVCLEIYQDPVILSCTHSFCRACLEETWASKYGRECPLCKRSSKELPVSDRALKNACESYIQKKMERDSRPQHTFCSVHSEKIQLFCVDDETLVCLECVSQNHQNHSFCAISKAADTHKAKLNTDLTTLEEKLDAFRKAKHMSNKIAAHIKSQNQQTEKQISAEFKKLHQFLQVEENFRISELRKEVEKKSWRMKRKIDELETHIQNISGRIEELKDKLKDDTLLLQDFRGAFARAQYSVPVPVLDDGTLINVTEHVGNLVYQLWEKMKNFGHYFPVILNPNSANPSLSLSEDLSSFWCSDENSELPDNPERMSAYHGVLGSEGFTSGTHSWDVDVGDSEKWLIGVTEESVNRKDYIVAIPENGSYCIYNIKGEIIAGISKDYSKKLMTAPIRTVRVTLNYENGQVCFSDMNNNKQLHTFKCRFTMKMFPYFYNKSKNPIKILSEQVSVHHL